jgi:hypothetical protein
MNDLKKIVWLASYPKSGNTWFRIFLSNLMHEGDGPVDINELMHTPMASGRVLFDELSGVKMSDLTREEITRLRPLFYNYLAETSEDTIFSKIHDAYRVLPGNIPLIPAKATKAVVYFIRNPLDVAVSFANHLNTSIDATIEHMENDAFAFCHKTDRIYNQVNQELMSWSKHVRSWTEQSGLPLKVVKYEDMLRNTFQTFKGVLEFIGLHFTADKIEMALRNSSFEILQQQEKEKGFKEKGVNPNLFFRKGKQGTWREQLSDKQANRIISTHKDVMKKFKYFDN